MNKKQHTTNKGFALLLSLIISSIALSIGLSMLHITLKELSLGTTTRGSEIAFQAANAGMECLRYTRNKYITEIIAGDEVPVDCLGSSIPNLTDSGSGNVKRYQAQDIEWSPSGGSLCINLDMYVLDTDAEGADIDYTFPSGVVKTCSDGDVCTFGLVRGYNRSCADVSGSIFTVQRELTIEF